MVVSLLLSKGSLGVAGDTAAAGVRRGEPARGDSGAARAAAAIIRLLERTLHSTSQLPVRICILLMVGLVALAREFGLDVILGAFGAGMVVRLASTGEKGECCAKARGDRLRLSSAPILRGERDEVRSRGTVSQHRCDAARPAVPRAIPPAARRPVPVLLST